MLSTEGEKSVAKLVRACGGCLGTRRRKGVEDCEKLGGVVKRILIPSSNGRALLRCAGSEREAGRHSSARQRDKAATQSLNSDRQSKRNIEPKGKMFRIDLKGK
jgi:hypothetical protein